MLYLGGDRQLSPVRLLLLELEQYLLLLPRLPASRSERSLLVRTTRPTSRRGCGPADITLRDLVLGGLR